MLDGINEMNRRPERAAAVLLDGAHEPGQPLPGVWTENGREFRVDYRAYAGPDVFPVALEGASQPVVRRHLWAEVYRKRSCR